MDHYATLGIPPGATADEVRQAYLALAKKYHPDKNKSPGATTMMAEINLAYEILCDSQRRKEYDLVNGIAAVDVPVAEQYDEEEEEEQEPSPVFGKCVRCNFVNSSGVFVCSVCGYTFDPEGKGGRKAEYDDDGIGFDFEAFSKAKRHDSDDIFEELAEEDDAAQDSLSEIIRCPKCNEINRYSRGSCWQCGLVFEIGEIA